MEALAAMVGAVLAAVLAWATKTYRERKFRRLEAENASLKGATKGHEVSSKMYRLAAGGSSLADILGLRRSKRKLQPKAPPPSSPSDDG